MPRRPDPWYWKARGAWYVQINGKQIRLHEDERRARQEFFRVMAASGSLDERQRKSMSVADACEAMLAQVQTLRASTRRHYGDKLGLFAEVFGNKRLPAVTPQEVLRWVAAYQPPKLDSRGRPSKRWGETSRAMQFRYVKLLFKWARDTGIIDINPFASAANPWKIRARDRAMNPDEYEAVMKDPDSSDEFKEVVEFVWRTGARPGEVAIMSAKHMDARHPIVRLQPTEHKTGTRTGLQREIYFPPDLWARLKKYAEMRKQGPLLRRPNGKPWTAGLITLAFCRSKRRLRLECVLYQARHSFITTHVENGVPLARVAKLAGHTKVETVMQHYYHPDTELMAQDVGASADAEAERMERIRREVEAKRAEAEAERAEHKRKLSTERKRRWRAKKERGDQGT